MVFPLMESTPSAGFLEDPALLLYYGAMRIEVDVHTHTIASGHAYSTIEEMARAARKRGLKGFVIADHGPGLNCGPHPWHFGNLRVLPEKINGVRIYRGAEANIMSSSGLIDLDESMVRRLDFVLAGLHEAAYAPGSEEENTRAMVAALENPLVDAISHPGNPIFPVDFKVIAAAAKKNGKSLEINESSFRLRRGSDESCPKLAALCAELGADVACGTDAHWSGDVGRFEQVLSVLKETGIPKASVLNASVASFEAFLKKRRERLETAVAS
jgi:putative hydrolase